VAETHRTGAGVVLVVFVLIFGFGDACAVAIANSLPSVQGPSWPCPAEMAGKKGSFHG